MIKHGNIEGRLMAFSAIIGCVFAVLTLAKPETARYRPQHISLPLRKTRSHQRGGFVRFR